jgi:hypothetical protein
MHRLAILALLTFAAAVAGAPAASAATIETDTSCYQEQQEVVVRGTGFTPLSTVNVARDGKVFASAQADANGAFVGKFATPVNPNQVRERLHELSASDMINTATTRYRSTKIFASFKPGSGNPATLRVRFTIFGFGLRQVRSTCTTSAPRAGSGGLSASVPRPASAAGSSVAASAACSPSRPSPASGSCSSTPAKGTSVRRASAARRGSASPSGSPSGPTLPP